MRFVIPTANSLRIITDYFHIDRRLILRGLTWKNVERLNPMRRRLSAIKTMTLKEIFLADSRHFLSTRREREREGERLTYVYVYIYVCGLHRKLAFTFIYLNNTLSSSLPVSQFCRDNGRRQSEMFGEFPGQSSIPLCV